MIDEQATDFATEFAKQAAYGTPAAGLSGLFLAVGINTWVAILGGFYILLQIAYLSRKWWREEHPKRQNFDGQP